VGQFIAVEERDGHVAVVTIDNPPVNALSAALLDELSGELARLDDDESVRAVVIRGAGERAFVAGADIKEFPSLRDAPREGGSARGIQKVGAEVERMRTPVIAAVHGFCLGGGLELAIACDIRVAAEDAQIGQPEIKLGLLPGGGGTQRLPRLVGEGKALEMNLNGEPIGAAEALRYGLANQVVPDHELFDTALAWARGLSEKAPIAIEQIKSVSAMGELGEGLEAEAQGFAKSFTSEDAKEGISAFLGKRKPRFQGK
jgi:enoyl-CoA hydratase/carnithine racemase